eukprot:TRINITY_DN35695_c0_g1_i1.p1 TRINITY_DN35695_c0_g1~~TRINITY_DN35695_c0_g1_i1.p1  ORF type:complete len:896 (-),score=178.98 TRINITY_DN35695_c0_g1_i1:45-2732(-)
MAMAGEEQATHEIRCDWSPPKQRGEWTPSSASTKSPNSITPGPSLENSESSSPETVQARRSLTRSRSGSLPKTPVRNLSQTTYEFVLPEYEDLLHTTHSGMFRQTSSSGRRNGSKNKDRGGKKSPSLTAELQLPPASPTRCASAPALQATSGVHGSRRASLSGTRGQAFPPPPILTLSVQRAVDKPRLWLRDIARREDRKAGGKATESAPHSGGNVDPALSDVSMDMELACSTLGGAVSETVPGIDEAEEDCEDLRATPESTAKTGQRPRRKSPNKKAKSLSRRPSSSNLAAAGSSGGGLAASRKLSKSMSSLDTTTSLIQASPESPQCSQRMATLLPEELEGTFGSLGSLPIPTDFGRATFPFVDLELPSKRGKGGSSSPSGSHPQLGKERKKMSLLETLRSMAETTDSFLEGRAASKLSKASKASSTCSRQQAACAAAIAAMPAFEAVRLIHPCLAKLSDPVFQCGDVTRTITAQELKASTKKKDPDERKRRRGSVVEESQTLQGNVPLNSSSLGQLLDIIGEYAVELQKPHPVLPLRVSPDETMAALSAACFVAGLNCGQTPGQLTFHIRHDSTKARGTAVEQLDAYRNWRELANGAELRCTEYAPLIANSYRWLRSDKSNRCFMERLACACQSLRHTSTLVNVTRMTKEMQWLPLPKTGVAAVSTDPMHICIEPSTDGPIEAAVNLGRVGRRVAVALPMNLRKPGGAFLLGGCHGLQEELCVRSTIYRGLLQGHRNMLDRVGGKDEDLSNAITEGAYILPHVELFRNSMSAGYMPFANPILLSSVVCFDLAAVRDRYRGVRRRAMLQAQLANHLRLLMQLLLRAASHAGAQHLVISDVGCVDSDVDVGVFADAVSQAILAGQYRPMQFVLSGSHEFQCMVLDATAKKRPGD